MYSDRLLKLARILDSVKEEEFDINRWQSSCGTVACAIGHATNDEYFKALGLTLVPPAGMPTGSYSEGHVPHFQGSYGIFAVAKIFDITAEDAERLFTFVGYANTHGVTPLSYGTHRKVHPSDVAQRIRLFVYD